MLIKLMIVSIILLVVLGMAFLTMAELFKIKTKELKYILIIILGGIGLTAMYIWNSYILKTIEDNKTIVIKNINDPIDLLYSLEPTEDNFKAVCKHYGVIHIEEVYQQAVLETNHFRSVNFVNRNNALGLVSGNKTKNNPNGYFIFDHWTDSILGYVMMVQYKIKEGEDYYEFLKRIGYAEDPKYINKLKQMVRKNGQ